MRTLVNENKLYSVIGNFFAGRDNLVLELVQNARRARARNVAVEAPCRGGHPFGEVDRGRLLMIRDDGHGIHDIVALLGIAFSGWEAGIADQQPAGMGFLQLLALSERVQVRSAFGRLELDSRAFLQDPGYRGQVASAAYDPAGGCPGTEIHALMKYPAWMYLKSDRAWYGGYTGMGLTMNGEAVPTSGIRARYLEARAGRGLYELGRFKGNLLLIGAGCHCDLSPLSGSAVNWYGQLIPFQPGSGSLAGNPYVRVYYEVRKGTPLTPRYPDRTSLVYDEACRELQDHVAARLERLLPPAYADPARFPSFPGAVSLLSDLYRHLDPDTLRGIPWVPLRRDVFRNEEGWFWTPVPKAGLEGYRFCTENLRVAEKEGDDQGYSLGADLEGFGLVQASEHVAPCLRELGLKEVAAVRVGNPPRQTVTLEPLRLDFSYTDGSRERLALPKAMLATDCNEAYIYAPGLDEVLEVYDAFAEETLSLEDYRNWNDLVLDTRRCLVDTLVGECGTIASGLFSFLPDHHRIRNISFESGRVRVAYADGSSKSWATLEAS
jgi:hypothetical protein